MYILTGLRMSISNFDFKYVCVEIRINLIRCKIYPFQEVKGERGGGARQLHHFAGS